MGSNSRVIGPFVTLPYLGMKCGDFEKDHNLYLDILSTPKVEKRLTFALQTAIFNMQGDF